MSKLEQIQNEILSLSQEERELLNVFIKTNNSEQNLEYTDAWKVELQSRLEEMETATVSLVSTKSAIADIRAKIRK